MIDCINLNIPAVLGLVVYESFNDLTSTDDIVRPSNGGEFPLGGHAVAAVGYDMVNRHILIKNSYGTEWGNKGYAKIPFEYYEYLVFECWAFDINFIVKDVDNSAENPLQ